MAGKPFGKKFLRAFSSSTETWCWSDDANRSRDASKYVEPAWNHFRNHLKRSSSFFKKHIDLLQVYFRVVAKQRDLNKKSSEFSWQAFSRNQQEIEFRFVSPAQTMEKPMKLAWKAVDKSETLSDSVFWVCDGCLGWHCLDRRSGSEDVGGRGWLRDKLTSRN